MPDPRLALALEQIGPGDWQLFENFASEFLVIRFPNLRTTASPHGDRGRDGQLHVVDEDVRTALQYSVAADWRAKIRSTVVRLSKTLPSVRELVYATSQLIGPDADELKAELWRENNLTLDVCDRTWFADRQSTAPQRVHASEELITAKVRPILVERRVATEAGPTLDTGENRLALLHLSLESSDEATQKSLTKSCFEALTLAALHGTSLETAITKGEIVERVKRALPAGHDQQVAALVESAVSRLSRKSGPVHHIAKLDVYHLSYVEQRRLEAQTSQFLLDELDLERQLVDELRATTGLAFDGEDTHLAVGQPLRLALEAILLRKGELFALATTSGKIDPITPEEIMSLARVMGPPRCHEHGTTWRCH